MYTYKLTGVKKTKKTHISHASFIGGDKIDYRCWLKMTGCRIVECKHAHTSDKKSNNPLPHNREKSVALVYSK